VHIGVALEELVRRLGMTKTLSQYDVLTSWQDIVGEQIARVTVPERIHNGILFITVATASWREELSMRRKEILERINKAAGKNSVKEIRFR
jgi:predicted nucleic acid-binding Zn ribbon protein